MATLSSILSSHGGLIQTGPFGSQLKQSEYTPDGIAVVMPKDIIDGTIRTDNIARVSEQKAEQLSRHALKAGSIIFPRRGDIGKCALITGETEGFLCGTGCIKIEVPPDKIDSDFLYYYLTHPDVTAWLENNAIGSTMLNLNTQILGRLDIPGFSLEQQRAISSVGKSYDLLIQNNRRRIQLLEESARLLYQEWFVHLRFPGHEHVKVVDGVPEGWVMSSASDVMEIQSGGTPKTKVAEYWGGSIPFFTPKDTTDCAFTYSTEKTITEAGLSKCNSKLYPKYTVFITARGTVGKISFAQQPMAMNQSCYALQGKDCVTQQFLYCSLISSIEQYKARASGSVFDAIVVDTFNRIPFLTPSEQLIKEFTEVVGQTFEQVDKLVMMNMKLTQARDLLLPRLMNGELTP